MAAPTLNKKTFNLIVAGVGCVMVLVLLFGALKIRLPHIAWPFGHKQEVAQGPLYPIYDEATFNQLAQPYRVEPTSTPDLSFEIKLPKDWTVDTAASDVAPDFSKRIIGDVATLRSPYINVYQPEVTVQTMQLQHDMTAAAWLQYYILSNSYILQDKIVAPDLYHAQGTYTYIKENDVMLVRIAATMNGQEAVITRFEMPLSFKDAMGFLQKRAIDSFHLLAPHAGTVEEQKPFALAELVKFSYPVSWTTSAPDLRDMDRIGLQLFNKSPAGVFQGYIQIFVVKRHQQDSFEREADILRSFVNNTMKLDVLEMTGTQDIAAHDKYIFHRMETYRAKSLQEGNIATQELRLVALGSEDNYIFLLLLSPEAGKDLYNWARNTRALDLITQSIQ